MMLGQSGGHRMCLAKLNDQLTCKLCGGYFIDATTIIECLHSFCKSCIVKYLENNKYCPICDVQIHKSKPLLNIRSDRILQDIVYKLVPGCYQNEMRCRREFYAKHSEVCTQAMSPEERGEPVESYIYSPDESLCLSLEYYNPHMKDLNEINVGKSLLRRYFRCPAAVTVFHLQKLIRAKYGLGDANKVDIMYGEKPLDSSLTLMDVMYSHHWKRKEPLHLSYRIFETASKRLKLSEDNASYKQSLMDAGIDYIELKDEKSLKREWKEVQLKISETGVMSVTDISNTVHKRDAGIENLRDEKTSEKTINTVAESNKTDLIENSGTSSVEVISPTLIIDTQMTKNTIFSDSSNTFLVANNDVKFTSENSSTKNCVLLTNQHNGTTRQANEMRNCTASAKLQQDAQEVKTCIEITKIEDKPETVSQGQKDIGHSATQFTEENAVVETAEKKDAHVKKNSINNNNSADFQAESQECIKNSNETKMGEQAGSKIDALSVKLQFQPKMGQVSNTYSKKALKEKRATLQQNTKKSDVKSSTEDIKFLDAKTPTNYGNITDKVTTIPSLQKLAVSTVVSQNISDFSSISNKQKASLHEKDNQIDLQQALNLLEQKNSSTLTESAPKTSQVTSGVANQKLQNNSVAAMNEAVVSTVIPNVSTSTISQTTSTFPYMLHDVITNSVVLKSALKNSNSIPQKPSRVSPVVCSTSNSQMSVPQFNISQPSSVNVYSVPTSLKNNVSQDVTTITATSTATITTTAMSKPMAANTCPIPPCPDAIPISLMKSMRKQQDVTAKGTNLNEICAKIGFNTIGSKINDICAKIGENSKEKNRMDAHGIKPDVPDLLRISAKKTSLLSNSDAAAGIKHIPNIPNVPVYTPSGNATTMENKNAAVKSILPPTSTSASGTLAISTSQRLAPLKKQNQSVGYKTLRDPPKSWNPTLSKNNYVAVKNQAKEMQNQTQTSVSEGTNKQIPSKPAKIFKMRNMPRYLGNPASGVKPMYGVTNDTKEKEQSTNTKSANTLNMMKIDPKTLSPIVSTINSPIVSPPPYSPNARSYQNTPFSRDICRNTGSPISPRNSPVNMLSTNPFIPSPTPNTNPRIIYSHFPPPFPDASRFPNPLIRSPIGIPPPSAFHSSLPPSINKLYQRSSYIPQTTGYAPVVGQPPTVQRIPPSTHSSSPKSPKVSSPSSMSSTSFNQGKAAESQSPVTTSSVDSVALLLSKSVAATVSAVPVPVSVSLQRELNAFNLSKTGAGLSSSQTTSNVNVKMSTILDAKDTNVETQLPKPNSSMSLNLTENSTVSNGANERKSKEMEARKAQETAQCKDDNSRTKSMETKCSIQVADNVAISHDKKEKNQVAKINGDVTTEQFTNKKSKEDNGNDETATTVETTKRDCQVERFSSKERNSISKSNTQANVSISPADDSKSEDLGKSDEIQGNKSEVQKSKAET
ncbi:serine-rich adhesin for platelets [Monomorium pharaonis]|uniref:serine-rich adhesin for platelets n=1 Tax=Monomorium pharaonis TaxID=307658 RepID=UPI0017468F78|nr:serine-rich adhesin for platelets [Monomorium pharaonis]